MLLVTYQNPEKKKLVSSDRFERAPFSVANEKKANGQPPAETNRLGGSVTTFFLLVPAFPIHVRRVASVA